MKFCAATLSRLRMRWTATVELEFAQKVGDEFAGLFGLLKEIVIMWNLVTRIAALGLAVGVATGVGNAQRGHPMAGGAAHVSAPQTPHFAAPHIAAAPGAAILVGLFSPAAAMQELNPDALWNIVHGHCVPNQLQHGNPAPCVEVDVKNGVERGYAVLKDIHGAAQFLLIPTKRVSGIEDSSLLARNAINYFAAAWRARGFVEKALGRKLPDDDLSLAVNSMLARSQDQLHIHIDCIRAAVGSALARERAEIGERWKPLRENPLGHRYQAMRVTGHTLVGHNPFRLLAQRLPGARADMGQRTLVVVGMASADGFIILEDRADPLHGDFARGAQLQDPSCSLAG